MTGGPLPAPGIARRRAIPFFIAGDPAQALVPGGAILWGPGYPTVEAATAHMVQLARSQSVRLIVVEAPDFLSAVRRVQDWPWRPAAPT